MWEKSVHLTGNSFQVQTYMSSLVDTLASYALHSMIVQRSSSLSQILLIYSFALSPPMRLFPIYKKSQCDWLIYFNSVRDIDPVSFVPKSQTRTPVHREINIHQRSEKRFYRFFEDTHH